MNRRSPLYALMSSLAVAASVTQLQDRLPEPDLDAPTPPRPKAPEPEKRDVSIWVGKPWTDAQKRRWLQKNPQSPAHVFQEQRNAFRKALRTLSNAQLRAELVRARRDYLEGDLFEGGVVPEARHEIIEGIMTAFCVNWKIQFTAATSIPYEDTLDLDRYNAHLRRIAASKAADAEEAE